jgi:hypothetical protein
MNVIYTIIPTVNASRRPGYSLRSWGNQHRPPKLTLCCKSVDSDHPTTLPEMTESARPCDSREITSARSSRMNAMPESKGHPADLPKAKKTHCMNDSVVGTITMQPYLANQSFVARGNSAIWQQCPMGIHTRASFTACVWAFLPANCECCSA